jgi:hypothetical protein
MSLHQCLCTTFLCRRSADTVDMGQRNDSMLIVSMFTPAIRAIVILTCAPKRNQRNRARNWRPLHIQVRPNLYLCLCLGSELQMTRPFRYR